MTLKEEIQEVNRLVKALGKTQPLTKARIDLLTQATNASLALIRNHGDSIETLVDLALTIRK